MLLGMIAPAHDSTERWSRRPYRASRPPATWAPAVPRRHRLRNPVDDRKRLWMTEKQPTETRRIVARH